MKRLLSFFVLSFAVFASGQTTFQSGYCHQGRAFWVGLTSELEQNRYRLDLAEIAKYKAQGVDWFGITTFDDTLQTTGVKDEIYPVRLQLELISTQSRCVLRTLPWLDTSTAIFADLSRGDPYLEHYARMLKGLNFKRIGWAINPEPAQLAKVVSRDPWLAVPYIGEEFILKRLEKTKRLEEWYDRALPLIRNITGPDLTIFLSTAGWSHLVNYEYLDLTKKYPNTIRTADAYFEPWHNIEKIIEDAHRFYVAMGTKLMLTEAGIQDRSKVGTPEDVLIKQRIAATCNRLKIPYAFWLP